MRGVPERRPRAEKPWATARIAHAEWRSAAACRSADPELFFPISASGPAGEQAAEAKAICAISFGPGAPPGTTFNVVVVPAY